MFKGILNAMNSIHILLSLLLVRIATAQSGHGFGGSHGHSLNKRSPLAPGGDGICYTYIIQEHDTCARLAERYQITTSNIETWNVGSWGWPGCARLKQGDFVCLSSGALPMPVALPNAVCGPQVPGTQRPAKYGDLASLNPCPSNQCCAKSGQCGTSSAFCDASASCIFNCGPKSTQNKATAQSTTSRTTASKTTTHCFKGNYLQNDDYFENYCFEDNHYFKENHYFKGDYLQNDDYFKNYCESKHGHLD
ncbi:Chitin-binding, type 1 [Penicillium camemberti]|uniref:Chitin-binding, type 1 n=1 Tax=Penicillium camemberti (strain FM 013) TaxID=1429867 RepID=A0A0G4NZP7_PENC3|nr:Chitin-binding, type 1 [Penicillium camemberti]